MGWALVRLLRKGGVSPLAADKSAVEKPMSGRLAAGDTWLASGVVDDCRNSRDIGSLALVPSSNTQKGTDPATTSAGNRHRSTPGCTSSAGISVRPRRHEYRRGGSASQGPTTRNLVGSLQAIHSGLKSTISGRGCGRMGTLAARSSLKRADC